MKDSPDLEKEALEKLNQHENIIDFVKFFENDDSYNFILEYCPSGSLETLVEKSEAMPIKLVTYYTA